MPRFELLYEYERASPDDRWQPCLVWSRGPDGNIALWPLHDHESHAGEQQLLVNQARARGLVEGTIWAYWSQHRDNGSTRRRSGPKVVTGASCTEVVYCAFDALLGYQVPAGRPVQPPAARARARALVRQGATIQVRFRNGLVLGPHPILWLAFREQLLWFLWVGLEERNHAFSMQHPVLGEDGAVILLGEPEHGKHLTLAPIRDPAHRVLLDRVTWDPTWDPGEGLRRVWTYQPHGA